MNYEEGRNDRVNENSMIKPFRLSSLQEERWSLISLAYIPAETRTNMPTYARPSNMQRQRPPKGPAPLQRVLSESPFSACLAKFGGKIRAH